MALSPGLLMGVGVSPLLTRVLYLFDESLSCALVSCVPLMPRPYAVVESMPSVMSRSRRLRMTRVTLP